MIVRESIPLSSLTTFKIGGTARYVIDCENDAEIPGAIAFAAEHQLPWYLLGEGSNILADDAGYEGVIIRLLTQAITSTTETEGTLLIADAGVSWDRFVREAAAQSLWGVENLAGIPGTVGAAPVQNIGAYGSELKDSLAWVEAYDPKTNQMTRIENKDCAFGYRDSRFKREPGFVILRAAFLLSPHGSPKTGYKDLARLIAAGEVLDTPAGVGDAVRKIRAGKFPDLAVWGTAGSFFKNPVIPAEAFATLQAKYPEIPNFPGEQGVKVPLAWILDQVLSLKSYRVGSVRLFEAQPLVIVADANASAHDVIALAQEVTTRVSDATGITPEWEVRKLP